MVLAKEPFIFSEMGSGGGIGRHAGLKILWAEMSVRVRFPSRAPESLLIGRLRGFFYIFVKILSI